MATEELFMNLTLKKTLLTPMNSFYALSPKAALKLLFYLKQGHSLNLENPRTYTEKINWLKLYYRNDLMPLCADKYTVRQYVKDCGCDELLNELIWEGFDAREIPFDKLPTQFVMKVTHGSGFNIICKNKADLNIYKTIKMLNKWLKEKYLPCYGEWFYGIVKPRIIIENFLSEDNYKIPVDYKMYCFNNIEGDQGVGLTAVDIDRFTDHKRKVYDIQWKPLTNIRINKPYDTVSDEFKKPDQYENMLHYAKKLAAPFPHARIDFYVINHKIYFGEITFSCSAGFATISPREINEKMGNWIKLPNEKNNY